MEEDDEAQTSKTTHALGSLNCSAGLTPLVGSMVRGVFHSKPTFSEDTSLGRAPARKTITDSSGGDEAEPQLTLTRREEMDGDEVAERTERRERA